MSKGTTSMVPLVVDVTTCIPTRIGRLNRKAGGNYYTKVITASGRATWTVQRLAFTQQIGTPADYVWPVCRDKRCVNPDHLMTGSRAQMNHWHAASTSRWRGCGHSKDGNVYVLNGIVRGCLVCHQHERRRRARRAT